MNVRERKRHHQEKNRTHEKETKKLEAMETESSLESACSRDVI